MNGWYGKNINKPTENCEVVLIKKKKQMKNIFIQFIVYGAPGIFSPQQIQQIE